MTECVWCGGVATELDHVVPRTHPEQPGRPCDCYRVPACKRCNASKGRRTPDEWLAAGLVAPRTPRGRSWSTPAARAADARRLHRLHRIPLTRIVKDTQEDAQW